MQRPQQFVIIFGPPAVGKMTVGRELAALTGFKLFHNHLTIESVLPLFDYGTPEFNRLVSDFRTRAFQEVAASKLPGLIFTFAWVLNDPTGAEMVQRWCAIFKQQGWGVCFVELEASLQERLQRNRTRERLRDKPSKRDVALSEEILLAEEARCKGNTDGDFPLAEPFLKINNTALSPQEAAARIREAFHL